MTIAPRRGVHPFLASNGGFVYFNRRILDPQATQFNVTIYIGSGIELLTTSKYGVKVGYLYHHISNANIHVHNSGLDAHMIFAGFSRYP